ncbi:hypothetical protein EJ02DRAFT_261066 [Clathrospora elynae]|uniref:Uncharacterized protein n=1 Tax=Clathrospora elynae TaxID=706981 RepID=A0A6A5T235_9PLEO|nr:hypothetical protein EJ02DRAFT_261066 [Clathrospora elynae]
MWVCNSTKSAYSCFVYTTHRHITCKTQDSKKQRIHRYVSRATTPHCGVSESCSLVIRNAKHSRNDLVYKTTRGSEPRYYSVPGSLFTCICDAVAESTTTPNKYLAGRGKRMVRDQNGGTSILPRDPSCVFLFLADGSCRVGDLRFASDDCYHESCGGHIMFAEAGYLFATSTQDRISNHLRPFARARSLLHRLRVIYLFNKPHLAR